MDTQTQLSTKITTPLIPPAQLWIGNADALGIEVIAYIKQQLCNNTNTDCPTCAQIEQKQHHAITWCTPEKQYTLDDLKPIFHTISYALQETEKHFFILSHADFLSQICANKLLKSVEEPPQGYHFIFLAQRVEQILPTIKSRCIIKNISSPEQFITHSLAQFFITDTVDPISFLQTLDQSKISERETVELLDQLLYYWTKKYKENPEKQKNKSYVQTLTQAYKYLPMPGGSKIFWRNLFLQIHF